MSLTSQLPIYVTRRDANGLTGTYSLAAWMPLVAMCLVFINLIVWSLIALYEAILYVV